MPWGTKNAEKMPACSAQQVSLTTTLRYTPLLCIPTQLPRNQTQLQLSSHPLGCRMCAARVPPTSSSGRHPCPAVRRFDDLQIAQVHVRDFRECLCRNGDGPVDAVAERVIDVAGQYLHVRRELRLLPLLRWDMGRGRDARRSRCSIGVRPGRLARRLLRGPRTATCGRHLRQGGGLGKVCRWMPSWAAKGCKHTQTGATVQLCTGSLIDAGGLNIKKDRFKTFDFSEHWH